MKVQFEVDSEYMFHLMEGINVLDELEVIAEALSLYEWAIEMKKKGWDIYGVDKNGGDSAIKVSLPKLNSVLSK